MKSLHQALNRGIHRHHHAPRLSTYVARSSFRRYRDRGTKFWPPSAIALVSQEHCRTNRTKTSPPLSPPLRSAFPPPPCYDSLVVVVVVADAAAAPLARSSVAGPGLALPCSHSKALARPPFLTTPRQFLACCELGQQGRPGQGRAAPPPPPPPPPRPLGVYTGRQADRQTDRQKDRQTSSIDLLRSTLLLLLLLPLLRSSIDPRCARLSRPVPSRLSSASCCSSLRSLASLPLARKIPSFPSPLLLLFLFLFLFFTARPPVPLPCLPSPSASFSSASRSLPSPCPVPVPAGPGKVPTRPALPPAPPSRLAMAVRLRDDGSLGLPATCSCGADWLKPRRSPKRVRDGGDPVVSLHPDPNGMASQSPSQSQLEFDGAGVRCLLAEGFRVYACRWAWPIARFAALSLSWAFDLFLCCVRVASVSVPVSFFAASVGIERLLN